MIVVTTHCKLWGPQWHLNGTTVQCGTTRLVTNMQYTAGSHTSKSERRKRKLVLSLSVSLEAKSHEVTCVSKSGFRPSSDRDIPLPTERTSICILQGQENHNQHTGARFVAWNGQENPKEPVISLRRRRNMSHASHSFCRDRGQGGLGGLCQRRYHPYPHWGLVF